MTATAPNLPDVCQACLALRSLAGELHAEVVKNALSALADKLQNHRFNVAFFGQFKRGKSTIINALTARHALPTGVIPVTSVATLLREGAEDIARVTFMDGQAVTMSTAQLSDYVTEARNPNNAKRVDLVDVQLSSTILAHGLCLVDTPGLGSVYRHNSQATQEYMANIDVAVLVTGLDPPLTDDELSMLVEASAHAAASLVIVNKVDKVAASDAEQALTFVRERVSEALKRPDVPFFAVSAWEYLEKKVPTRDWARMAERLRQMAAVDADAIVMAAGERGVARSAEALQRLIDQRRQALLDTSEAMRGRIEALRAVSQRAYQKRGELRYGLKANAEAIEEALREHHRAFLAGSLPRALGTFRNSAHANEMRSRKDIWDNARSLAGALLEDWRQCMQPQATASYNDAVNRFIDTANDFLDRTATETGLERDALPPPLARDAELRGRSHLFYTDLMSLTSVAPWRWFFDLFMPRAGVVRASLRAGERYIHAVLETNSARIVNDLRARMDEARQQVERDQQTSLQQAVETAEHAARHASDVVARGQAAVDAELRWLQDLAQKLAAIRRYRTPIPAHAGFSP